MTNCGRCYALKGEIRRGTKRIIGPNGIPDHICDECFDEIENIVYENEENENAY